MHRHLQPSGTYPLQLLIVWFGSAITYCSLFVVCLSWGLTSLQQYFSISQRQPHETSYSAATLEHSCHRQMTGASHPVILSTDTGPTSHASQHSPFNAERKEGGYWYHLLTTFSLSRLGIEPTTFRTPSERSTTIPPGPVMLVCYLTRLNPTTCSSELWPLVHNDYNNNFFTYLSQPHQRDDIII